MYIVSNNFAFTSLFKKEEKFKNIIEIKDLSEIEEKSNLLIIDGETISVDSLSEYLKENEKEEFSQIFYLTSDRINYYYALTSLDKKEFLDIQSGEIGKNKFIEYVSNTIGGDNAKRKNVFVFSGSTQGIGCTNISTSISKLLANNEDITVAQISLDGTPGADYLTSSIEGGLDSIKSKLFTNILSNEEIMQACEEVSPNLYFLRGTSQVPFKMQYTPEIINNLLEKLSLMFDIVICDVGSDYTLGMAIGALLNTDSRFVVLGQSPKSAERFKTSLHQILKPLNINDFFGIINKYKNIDGFVTEKEFLNEYQIPIISTINVINKSEQCEIDNKTITDIDNLSDSFGPIIDIIASIVEKDISIKYKKRRGGLFG